MKIIRILAASFLVCIALPKHPLSAGECMQDARHPIYIKMQYAGNMGLVSVGAGKTVFNKRTTVDLNYGYLPESINGVEVHTFALRPAVHFKGFTATNVNTGYYLGAALTYSRTNNTYLQYPSYYPRDYYMPNAVHINPMLGILMKKSLSHDIPQKQLAFFAEIGTVDVKLIDALANRAINAAMVWSLSFGMALIL